MSRSTLTKERDMSSNGFPEHCKASSNRGQSLRLPHLCSSNMAGTSDATLTFCKTVLFGFGVLIITSSTRTVAAREPDIPPVKTEVKYVEDKDVKNDDPAGAWEEWDETPESRKNPFPRRQRKIEVGMDINTIMGMAMRQPKVVTAVLTERFGSDEKVGQSLTHKFYNQMTAAGIGCKLWFVKQGRQVIANCETIRDGHMCKDYLVRQPEIMRTVLDNVPFTPKPSALDDDEDDDDDDDDNGDGDEDQKVPNHSGKTRSTSSRLGETNGSVHSVDEEEIEEKPKSEL